MLYAQGNRAGTLPYVVKTLKVKEDLAGKIYDLSLPGFTKGYVKEEIQREAYTQAVTRLGAKEPPPMERIFNYTIVQKLLAELESKNWKPGS